MTYDPSKKEKYRIELVSNSGKKIVMPYGNVEFEEKAQSYRETIISHLYFNRDFIVAKLNLKHGKKIIAYRELPRVLYTHCGDSIQITFNLVVEDGRIAD